MANRAYNIPTYSTLPASSTDLNVGGCSVHGLQPGRSELRPNGKPQAIPRLVQALKHRQIVSLVALQGVLYAIGGGKPLLSLTIHVLKYDLPYINVLALMYAPTIYYMSEWFVVRRGLASGAINAGL